MTKTHMLQRGNLKLDKSVATFSLPPGLTCHNCKDCWDTCYARKAMHRPNVQKAWTRNYNLALRNPRAFVLKINEELADLEHKGVKYVRVHVGGDFFSQEYIGNWETIAVLNPNLYFYAYTKVMDMFDFRTLSKAVDNFFLINSYVNGKYLNYGDYGYCRDILIKLHGEAFICPVTDYSKEKCGKDCLYCMTGGQRPLFIKH